MQSMVEGAQGHTDAPGRHERPGYQRANNGGAKPVVGTRVPLPGPELCSAVMTGILGVHRGDPGRLAECPTAAGS